MTPTGAYVMDLETTWIVQAAFLSALAFVVSYSWLYRWWVTVIGRVLGTIALAVAAYNLQPVLTYWHALSLGTVERAARNTEPGNWSWFGEQCRALLPIAFLVLTWTLWRLRRHSRQHVGPAAQVHPVNGRAQH